jgi:hypothetical protein
MVIRQRLEQYFHGVPKRFRDVDRYVVRRTLHLRFPAVPTEAAQPEETVKVYELASGALASEMEGARR